jgi:CRP-like cAMP-binding protein
MTEADILGGALTVFANLTEESIRLSLPSWQIKEYKKGEWYNEYRNVCKYLGFIISGCFRSYIINDKNDQEKNVFLYSKNQFVVTFQSFISQTPCNYHTQAIEDAQVICISYADLQSLYRQSHDWERFGRLLAQEAFSVTIERLEGFLISSPEERYLELIKKSPDIFNEVPLYHISSYLGIQGPSLSRIRKRLREK